MTPPGPPSDERTLEHLTTIRGDISPKSIVSSHTGVFFAQNMMYRHTITVYDRDHELVTTIPDTVMLEDHGIDGPGTELRGSPVELAFSPDGEHAYVSNYKMYGPGFDRGGGDTCSPADGYDESFVYRIDVDALEIDRVIPVGSVPKYVAATPDGRHVLVTNWCSYDVSIDTQLGEEIERVHIGRYPRGIAVTSDSSTAYIAVMGSTDIAVLDLEKLTVTALEDVGRSPRHLSSIPRIATCMPPSTARASWHASISTPARRSAFGRAMRPARWTSRPMVSRCTSSTTSPTPSARCTPRT